jgi:hypothetical protein
VAATVVAEALWLAFLSLLVAVLVLSVVLDWAGRGDDDPGRRLLDR